MKILVKILFWVLLVVVLIAAGFYTFVELSWNKTFDAPYPEISASTDSTLIARGAYLAYGPAHCVYCHGPQDKIKEIEAGERLPLMGGWEITIPPGTFRAPNITPHAQNGIGRYTDAELARIMRHMVGPNGRCIMPFMPFAELSDEDLTAVISFLRSQDPVDHEVALNEFTFIGKMVMATGMLKPEGTKGSPPKSVTPGPTVEYGKYLTHSVADCRGCHTNRDMKTGALIGELFAGGMIFNDQFTKGYTFVSPNLTPHPTGIINEWTEEDFIQRFRAGRVYENSPMPWGAFSRMHEDDLRAIYRYLRSLDGKDNEIIKVAYSPDEEAPVAK